jgi:di/tricarboxylate transporter
VSFEAIITLLVVGVMLVALVCEYREADVIVFSALGVLLLTGVLTPKEAFEGFANKGMLTVAVLFIVAYAAQTSGMMELVFDRAMGEGDGPRRSLLRMMLPVMGLSAFINNTPLVAMFTPYVREWALRHKLAPSKFLIPLSYAVSFGGMFTLIGTSTNLVVNGLLQQTSRTPIGMFEIGYVGLPCGLAALVFMVLWGQRLLPDNSDLSEEFPKSGREYLLEMQVQPQSPVVGKTVEAAGLRNLKELFLVEIVRNGDSLIPVKPSDCLKAEDRLIFTGLVGAIVQLQKIPGLVPFQGREVDSELRRNGEGRIIEAVVSPSSPMLGKTIKEGNFRSRYDAAVLAVHRHGERVVSKIGEIVLRPGDTLLLLAGNNFLKTWNQSRDFYMVSKISDVPVVNKRKSILVCAALFGMVALSSLGIMEIFLCAILATIVLLLSRCLTAVEARRSLELNVLIVIAASFGISRAIEKTGVATLFAERIVAGLGGFGPVGVLAAIFLVTALITEAITNNAAAALMFPIAMAAASQLGMDPKPFAIAVAVAASASFATTIGYQTNMMVSGPGGYKALDFVRAGLPVKLIYATVAIPVIAMVWRF